MSIEDTLSLRRANLRACRALVCAAALMGATPLAAQEADAFGSILSRYRPEYSKPPIIVGGFEVSPTINLDVEAINNVFASDLLDRNDVKLSLRPGIDLRDQRTDRQLSLNVRASLAKYLRDTVSDRVEMNASGQARFGLGTRTRPYFGFEFRQNDSSRTDFTDLSLTAQPIKLTSIGANTGVTQEFGPLTASVAGSYLHTNYRGEIVADSAFVNTAFNEFDIFSGRLRLAYSVNPAQRIYIEGQVNDRSYAVSQGNANAPDLLADRSSKGFAVRAGFARQITEILQLDANAGYLRQEFDNPAVATISSYSFDASLLYSPTRLTRFRLSAARTLDDTVNPFFNGLLRTEIGLGVEHELRRNLLLSAQGRYSVINPRDTVGAASTNIEEIQVSGAARYLISPRWSGRITISYFDRTSAFNGSQFRVLGGLAYSF